MADPHGFLNHPLQHPKARDPVDRVGDWREVYPGGIARALLPIVNTQAARCMDCGIPFCHKGCPLGNIIPEWNDLVWRDDWRGASDRLHATNNFPEFTGRVCPAPCESACVVAISGDPVAIKDIEVSIAERAWADGVVRPQVPEWQTGQAVAIVGSGPAGMAAAQQLTRVGHTVVVYERDDAPGGLLRYGIPEFKMEKSSLDRRLEQMVEEGTIFRTGVEVGRDISWQELRAQYDAVIVAIGSTTPRDLPCEGRDLDGVHFAMDYLTQANRSSLGQRVEGQISARGRHVVVVGGGDTGSDCIGTAHRQGAASVTQLMIHPAPGLDRPEHQPWPTYPTIWRVSSSQEEGGERLFDASTTHLDGNGDGRVRQLRFRSDGEERAIPADLVLLAMGFAGAESETLVEEWGLALGERGRIIRSDDYSTAQEGVYCCGDAGRGQSLVVWAIAEGRACAHEVDRYLSGASKLPRPVSPSSAPLAV